MRRLHQINLKMALFDDSVLTKDSLIQCNNVLGKKNGLTYTDTRIYFKITVKMAKPKILGFCISQRITQNLYI